jgi:flagellin
MSLRINTNIEAFDTHRQLEMTQNKLQQSMERLSSGYRINSAADDAAGLAISEKLTAQINGLDQANRNTQDAVSLVQTAEGQLGEVHSMLQRVRELAVESKNGTLSTQDQTSIQSEINQLACEIQRIGETAQFNGIPLLNGQVTITFQVGANDGEQISVTTATLYGSAIPTNAFQLDATDPNDISEIDSAINAVSDMRATYGAVQNRLEHVINNLGVYQENLTSSESQIKDVDMASEMSNLTQLQVLQQAGTSMLAQANQLPQSVLSLLRS